MGGGEARSLQCSFKYANSTKGFTSEPRQRGSANTSALTAARVWPLVRSQSRTALRLFADSRATRGSNDCRSPWPPAACVDKRKTIRRNSFPAVGRLFKAEPSLAKPLPNLFVTPIDQGEIQLSSGYSLSREALRISSSLRARICRLAYAGCDQFTTPSSRRLPTRVVGLMSGVRAIS